MSENMGTLFGEEAASEPVEGSMTFRQGLDELESIIRALEGNQLELEDSLEKYARGVTLLRMLQGKIDDAQQRVTVLLGEIEPDSTDDVDNQLS